MTRSDTMAVDDRQLACFLAAADELHFGRAAARMHMSQPPFSQQIRRLEASVGTALFIRTTRSVRLTPAGEVMYQHAREIAAQTQRMLRAVRQAAVGDGGTLVVGLAPTVMYSPLADALYRYRAQHPQVTLELREMNSNTMQAMLQSRSIDVALMRPMAVCAEIACMEVFHEPMVVALRRDHPWATQRRITAEQLQQLPLLGYAQAGSPYFRQVLQNLFQALDVQPHIVQESQIPTLLTLVEIGVGAAIVPWTLSRQRTESLKFLPLQTDGVQARACIVAAWHRGVLHTTRDVFVAAMPCESDTVEQ
ncbi:LysR family transcriptional regulator [Comamonas sp. GB3 AK4-5]|uniref:LysR family transcriptional regulator n=1 Tax=Comamonas sp. GB3 AK4-5 TaxID=3231487 RepID=UPI00351EEB45